MTRRRQDIIGKRFGKWTVLARITHKLPGGKDVFMASCQCDCGTFRDVKVANLTKGLSKSCGCDKSHYARMTGSGNYRFKGHKEIRGTTWSHIRQGALVRGIDFSITIEEAWQLYEKQSRKCALTGLPLVFDKLCGESTASLDRIDSTKGYTLDNIQWVHKDVNIMKNAYDVGYFVDICRLVAANAA